MDAADIGEKFSRTLTSGHENEGAREAIRELQTNGSREIFGYAAEWLKSDEPLKRSRAATVLGQLMEPKADPLDCASPRVYLFQEQACSLLVGLLDSETDPMVLNDVISALGHLGVTWCLPTIVPFAEHVDPDVRFAVVCALGCMPEEATAISTLLHLTADTDKDVRDWAVFGLGVQGTTDTAEIRETLLRCLEDADDNVRAEAVVGLAKRRDRRVLPMLSTMVEEDWNYSPRTHEAAVELLGLIVEPEGWTAKDCRAAMRAAGY